MGYLLQLKSIGKNSIPNALFGVTLKQFRKLLLSIYSYIMLAVLM